MSIELREINSPENLRNNWQQIAIMLQPIVDNLPKKEDRDYFKGIMSFLIGKEPRISNIQPLFMYIYIRKADFIVRLWKNKGIVGTDMIRTELVKYLNRLALHLSENGLLVKHGIGGFSQQYIEQNVRQQQEHQPEVKKRGWLG
jgi:hypothetical protein